MLLAYFAMKSSKSNISRVIIFTVGAVGVVFLIGNIISSESFPSLGEFMASSTPASINILEEFASTTVENELTYAMSVIHAPNGNIQVEISNNPTKRDRGLSNRISLDPNSGMLFIFPTVGSYSFWMKDMNFPIDIVWINIDRKVVGIDADASPLSYPKLFSPPDEIQFVLELNAGAADRFGIVTGTILPF